MVELGRTFKPSKNLDKFERYDHMLAGWALHKDRYTKYLPDPPLVVFICRDQSNAKEFARAADPVVTAAHAYGGEYPAEWPYPARERMFFRGRVRGARGAPRRLCTARVAAGRSRGTGGRGLKGAEQPPAAVRPPDKSRGSGSGGVYLDLERVVDRLVDRHRRAASRRGVPRLDTDACARLGEELRFYALLHVGLRLTGGGERSAGERRCAFGEVTRGGDPAEAEQALGRAAIQRCRVA